MKEPTAAKRQPRPVYYTRDQLDELCEHITMAFCMERYGQELTTIPTEALLQLLEEYTHDVDQTPDLPGRHQRGHGVWLSSSSVPIFEARQVGMRRDGEKVAAVE
jgi:hypothetical protein